MEDGRKSFIPRDEAKSWVVFDLAVLIGVLLAGLSMLGAYLLGLRWLEVFGKTLLFGCWVVAAIMLYVVRELDGRYSELQEHNWHCQL